MEYESDGWDELRKMRRQMNRLFNSFGSIFTDRRLSLDKELDKNYRNAWAEFRESGDEYIILIELPGVEKTDIHLDITEDRMLEVKAEKKKVKKYDDESEEKYGIAKTYFGFRRMIHLPEDADEQKLHASYNNGVLEVKLKKNKQKSRKEIKIE